MEWVEWVLTSATSLESSFSSTYISNIRFTIRYPRINDISPDIVDQHDQNNIYIFENRSGKNSRKMTASQVFTNDVSNVSNVSNVLPASSHPSAPRLKAFYNELNFLLQEYRRITQLVKLGGPRSPRSPRSPSFRSSEFGWIRDEGF